MAAPPPPRSGWSWLNSRPVRWVRHYFGYSRGEARGMMGILLLMLGFIIAPMLLRPELPEYLPATDQKALDELATQLKEHRATDQSFASRYPKREFKKFERGGSRYPQVAQVKLAPFDPNALAAEGWEARGVPHFVAARLEKYRAAAGGFKAKAQIKKMYGLEDSVYQRLAPFIQLPEEAPKRDYAANRPGPDGKFPPFASPDGAPSKFPRKPRNLQPFDLNTADTTQLMQIRGIGAGRAKWVVKYRNQLGGYLREDQLDEIFVLKDAPDLRDSLRKYTFVAPGYAPKTVNVNTASFDEMYLQPYIGKPRARIIVAYRQQHGPFKTVEDLKQIPILKPADWEKMRPYVRCQ
ncbi:helix-hairpin-helix domain-containing protein [Hymenobacter artigasi]|uniref:Competence ComEA-like helix-hairpin-helix protein n=1 Tax=Hymenobacter artigasi TaxID=2719616 RepID=A0ABX1HBE4_9BACT|nr:helix-hairpin-helix domain-containing protein [Hymenobacter artigasi]NKI87504.1 competence ComEA-like helix-hairpin-helix protein [Hymenobacter artigasi]